MEMQSSSTRPTLRVVIEPSATPRERLALRVVQAGAVATVLAALPFKPFDLDRFFVPKELVLLVTATLAGAILLAEARSVRLTRVDTLLAAFLALTVASAIGATNHWLAWRAWRWPPSRVRRPPSPRPMARTAIS